MQAVFHSLFRTSQSLGWCIILLLARVSFITPKMVIDCMVCENQHGLAFSLLSTIVFRQLKFGSIAKYPINIDRKKLFLEVCLCSEKSEDNLCALDRPMCPD